MGSKAFVTAILALIIFLLAISCLFVVQQGQSALLLRLGQITTDASGKAKVFGPGLQFKLPFINTVKRFDVRIQNLDAESPRILTKEQKYLYVDYYAKWKIIDLPLYYTRTGGDPDKTVNLLTQKINDSIRGEFGKKNLQEVISDDRLRIMEALRIAANNGARNLGIEIIDVRIKSIDLLQQVLESVYQRMRTKREQVATEYRSDGQAQAEKIVATADASAQKMIAEAKRKAALTRASGDQQAADISIAVYNQDPVFYGFYRRLLSYRQVLNKNTIMVLKPDNDFFKYFNSINLSKTNSNNVASEKAGG